MSDHYESRDRSREPREGPAPRDDEARSEFKCFVGGISWQLDDYKLKDVFAEFNPTDAKVMMDKMTQRSRGFGFVWFADEAAREAAIDSLHNTEVEGRRISVSKAVPQSQTAPGTPADALRRGEHVPREQGRVYRPGRGQERGYGGGYDRGYDRGGYSGGGGYDRGYGGYGGGYAAPAGYDRGGGYSRGGGYGGGYDRGYDSRGGYGGGYDQYRPDPYAQPPPAQYGAPGGYYDPRAAPGGYAAPAPQPYDDRYRGSYGSERHDRSARPGPYDRPPPQR